MSSRFHAILLFGYPGAGKGTQGDRLGSRKGFFHLATGDVFRSLDPDSEHGREFQYYAAKGLLVPDSLTMAIFRSYLYNQIAAERFQPEKEMLLLDGTSRQMATPIGSSSSYKRQHVDVLFMRRHLYLCKLPRNA